ncbi:MAG: ABC transporter ATP-binding protein [Ornithinimicrobium sp.]|uniref:ABC transporter ATP-binding protein n=1 Tax=Ornithinimicrobium sp. TaxID=1977084 RepID=UPI0026DFB072|nr:ABC transporter ATP-binding protein [Ornithinimicrobium sp.]MDO5739029.1 ABC transporter ATP-binding protein [Ornithinimicrobium sp.]
MSDVRLRGVHASYGAEEILKGVDLLVPSGGITAVLGDSGSGKTTLLKVVSGFLRPIVGEVEVGGRLVAGPGSWVAPEKRGVGYVRQDGGLFPHLSIAGNISFGLSRPLMGRREQRHQVRVRELLDMVELPLSIADRHPDELSGGQQQRVALARALAPHPDLVLLDEPFSALDTALRTATREATARALRAAGATTLLVTHDQGEALSFADEVAVLRDGSFRQVAPPRTIYGEPVDAHIAAFLGDAVILPGESSGPEVSCVLGNLPVAGFAHRGYCDVMLRPEQIQLTAPQDGHIVGTVTKVSYFGHDAVVHLQVPPGAGADLTPTSDVLHARVVGNATPEVGELVGIQVVGPARVFRH